jgi:hypothetical protein
MTIKLSVEKVTPDTALMWLAKMPKNRNIRAGDVARYARDMATGKWGMAGDTVKFDKKGNLIDGQHRLQAIIRADTTIELVVVRGLETEVIDVLDTGIKRTIGDALSLAGYSNSTNLSAAARLMMLIEVNKARGTTSQKGGVDLQGNKAVSVLFSNTEVLAFVEENPGLVEAVTWSATNYRKVANLQPSVMAVAYYTTSMIDEKATDEFWDAILNNSTDGAGDPRAVLLQRLIVAQRSRERISQGMKLSMIYRAWNAWRTGSRLHKMPVTRGNIAVQMPTPV